MSTKKRALRIWWVDDEPDRLNKSTKDAIETPEELPNRSARVRPIGLKKSEGLAVALKVLKEEKDKKNDGELPDLIVIDQMLQDSPDVQRGSSLAAVIHDIYPEIALVGVTGMKTGEVEELQKQKFIDFYERSDIATGACIPELYAIADGYSALIDFYNSSGSNRSISRKLSALVKCPKSDEDLFVASIPSQFKKPWDTGTSHVFAHWIWNHLLKRPGLLYDSFEVATLLGLKLEGFRFLEKQLNNCKYRGIFAAANKPRWWVSRVTDEIRRITKANMSDPLWKLGREMVGNARGEFFSKCHGRPHSTEVPTTVAYSDGTQRTRIQAAIADTEPLPSETAQVGFEQRRVFIRQSS